MKILIVDNYDSFTFNIYQYAGEILTDQNIEFTLDVIKNNKITIHEIKKENIIKLLFLPDQEIQMILHILEFVQRF